MSMGKPLNMSRVLQVTMTLNGMKKQASMPYLIFAKLIISHHLNLVFFVSVFSVLFQNLLIVLGNLCYISRAGCAALPIDDGPWFARLTTEHISPCMLVSQQFEFK